MTHLFASAWLRLIVFLTIVVVLALMIAEAQAQEAAGPVPIGSALLEIVLAAVALAVGSAVTAAVTGYLIPWLRRKGQNEFAELVERLLPVFLAGARKWVPGVGDAGPVPVAAIPELIARAKADMAIEAPGVLRRLGDTAEEKLLRRVEVAETTIPAETIVQQAKALGGLAR